MRSQCIDCGGTGRINCSCTLSGRASCPACSGEGHYCCPACSGRGVTIEYATIDDMIRAIAEDKDCAEMNLDIDIDGLWQDNIDVDCPWDFEGSGMATFPDGAKIAFHKLCDRWRIN